MNTIKTILSILLIAILSFNQSNAQGELLNINQSGGAFLFETASLNNERINAIGYSFIHKRKFETGISAFRTTGSATKGIGLYAAGFLNSDSWLQMKGSFGLSFAGGNTSTILSSTFFASNSQSTSKLIPSVSLLFVDGELAYSGGLHFKLGNAFNIIGGINATKYKNTDLVFGLSIGFLLANLSQKE